jgi:hypothetical protein
MPSIKAIIAAWKSEPTRPWRFAPDICWACGNFGADVERAHIIPHSGGGGMEPSNFFLLCHACHRTQPDNAPRKYQIAWLRTVPSWFAKVQSMTEILLDELRAIGGDRAIEEGLRLVGNKDINAEIIQEARLRMKVSGGPHFGNETANGQWHHISIVVEMVKAAMDAWPAPDAPSLAAAEQMELLS